MNFVVTAAVAKKTDSETVERLLDAAEKLFGEHGYDGVGMRALAEEAGVNLGAATYHFGTKENLYVQAFLRRFRPTNELRLQALREAVEEAGDEPVSVEKIAECMLRAPFMNLIAHPNFARLLARNLGTPPSFLQEAVHFEMAANHEPFLDALEKALPQLSRKTLTLRTMLSGGVLVMSTSKMSRLPLPLDASLCEAALQGMIAFVAGGMRAEPTLFGKELPELPLPG